jgi:hypothetical protein
MKTTKGNKQRTQMQSARIKKGKLHPRTRHEGPEGEKRYSSALSLTSALDVVGDQSHVHGTRCIGGWVGPRKGLDGAENLTPTGIRSPHGPTHSKPLYRLSYPGPTDDAYRAFNSACMSVHPKLRSTSQSAT